MKKLLKGTLTSLLLVSLATPGFAENRQGAFTVSPYVGGYVLDNEQHEENRPTFGLRTGYNFTENFGAEVMFDYGLTETEERYGSREADRYRYGLDLLYHFMPKSNLVPFVVLGGGGTNFNIPNTPSAKNHYAGLVNYGAGVKYFVNPDIALRGDVRHVLLVHDTGDHNLEYAVGLTFNLGGKRKTVAPIAEEAGDTTAPKVVFTAPVNGATALPVNQKTSVAFNEDMDQDSLNSATFTMRQGSTPVSGKVTSTSSTAIFTPARNLEKGKVYTAIVSTGAKDLAGNPMSRDYQWDFTAYSTPRVIGVLTTLDNSHFDFDSAAISENGKTILNGNVASLKANPKMKIRMAGHTSAAGSEEYNQLLSERRAVSVKEYLVKVGKIDENRLSTIGYGETKPVKFEATPSDKYTKEAYANMRVVIEIIED